MEEQAQKRKGPSMDALHLADAIKRIMLFDDGQLAERLDSIIRLPMLAEDSAMFFALTGKEPRQIMRLLGIDPEKIRKPTCASCHHTNGLHEPDCPNNPSPQAASKERIGPC